MLTPLDASHLARVPVPLAPGVQVDLYTAVCLDRLDPLTDLHGAILWPGALLAAQLVAGGPSLRGLQVLSIGSGTGLCALAAAARGATVTATDVSPVSMQLCAHAAQAQSLRVAVGHFDVSCPEPLPAADVVIAADVLYLSELTRSVGRRVAEAADRGSVVLLTDSRATHRDALLDELVRRDHAAACFESRRLTPALAALCDEAASSTTSVLRMAARTTTRPARLRELQLSWGCLRDSEAARVQD